MLHCVIITYTFFFYSCVSYQLWALAIFAYSFSPFLWNQHIVVSCNELPLSIFIPCDLGRTDLHSWNERQIHEISYPNSSPEKQLSQYLDHFVTIQNRDDLSSTRDTC